MRSVILKLLFKESSGKDELAISNKWRARLYQSLCFLRGLLTQIQLRVVVRSCPQLEQFLDAEYRLISDVAWLA
jgi:hypothetical protein